MPRNEHCECCLFLRVPTAFVRTKTNLWSYFVFIFTEPRKSRCHAEKCLPHPTAFLHLTSSSMVLGRAASFPFCWNRLIGLQFLLPPFGRLNKIFLKFTSSLRKPEEQRALLQQWGRLGEHKHVFSKEKLPGEMNLCLGNKDEWPPLQTSCRACIAEAASPPNAHSSGVWTHFWSC